MKYFVKGYVNKSFGIEHIINGVYYVEYPESIVRDIQKYPYKNNSSPILLLFEKVENDSIYLEAINPWDY